MGQAFSSAADVDHRFRGSEGEVAVAIVEEVCWRLISLWVARFAVHAREGLETQLAEAIEPEALALQNLDQSRQGMAVGRRDPGRDQEP